MITSLKRTAVVSLAVLTLSAGALATPSFAAGPWHGGGGGWHGGGGGWHGGGGWRGGGHWHGGGGWGGVGLGLAAGALAGAALAAPYYYDGDPGYPGYPGYGYGYGYAPGYYNNGCYPGQSMYNGC
jgi:hypothetical protein